MGVFKRMQKAAETVADLLDGEGVGEVSQTVPPVEQGPDASPLEEIRSLAAWAERSRAIAAAAPARKARVVEVAVVERLAGIPIVRLTATTDGTQLTATLPASGELARSKAGGTFDLHVDPNDASALALAAGTPARAVVQTSGGADTRERGTRTLIDRQTVALVLRPRLADGGFGPRSAHSPKVPRDAALLLVPGVEIPVLLDCETGELSGVDVQSLVDELEPRFDEARQGEDERHRRGLGFVKSALTDVATDLRSGDPAATQAGDTIEGVTADQWLLTRTAFARKPIPDAVRERVAQEYGVPAGRWSEIDAAWTERAEADPDLAARLGSAQG